MMRTMNNKSVKDNTNSYIVFLKYQNVSPEVKLLKVINVNNFYNWNQWLLFSC